MRITAHELHRAFHNALLFGSTDETIPMLLAVEITSDGKGLTLVATDRFTMGVARAKLDVTGGAWRFVMKRRDADVLVRALKTKRSEETKRTVDIECDHGLIGFALSTGESFGFDSHTSELTYNDFPKWRQLWPDNDTQEAQVVTGFTAEYLARFGRVLSESTRLRLIHFGVDKPRVVQVGDDFVGLIMPLGDKRLAKTWVAPEWLS